ncbi:MAG: hypothetical protein AAF965_06050 [Pseudomonadota bacterium]
MTGLATLLTLFFAGHQAEAEEHQEDVWAECRADNSCTIAYDYLSDQENYPFLFLGLEVNSSHPRWRDYKNTLPLYPHVKDCLIESEQSVSEPNLLRIDWPRTGTGPAAEICVFRIARSLGSVERILQWLEFHGFEHRGQNRIISEERAANSSLRVVAQITARWSIEQYRQLNPSFLARLTGYDLLQEYNLVLGFDKDGFLAEVRAGTPTNLN